MSRSQLILDWGIERGPELLCGGQEMAGGAISGRANFSQLGLSTVQMSAAWNIGERDPNPENSKFKPAGPAGGPFAPVLGPDDYPYHFQFNPFTQECDPVVSANGELVLTAANGHQLTGKVVGGETHRLDFVLEGDGVETFAIIEFDGGTGRFAGATGSFVVHTIIRFDWAAFRFVMDLAEILPGGTIAY